MRKFEKISKPELKKSFPKLSGPELTELWESISLPSRSTAQAAGYDFFVLSNITIPPRSSLFIPTGIKASLNPNEVLFLILRSSAGIKHGLKLSNQVGVIDADYYNNPDNEGHIFYKLENPSDKVKTFVRGDRLAQGIFLNYLTVDDETENLKKRSSSYH